MPSLFQQRVIDEKAVLDEKLDRLHQFIGDEKIYPILPKAEQDRLKRQVEYMSQYSMILGERIAAFQ